MSFALDRAVQEKISWQRQAEEDPDFPLYATFKNQRWEIHLNDFPNDPLYSVFSRIDGERVFMGDLDDWPPAWKKDE
jgi:hypothetical protein